MTPIMDCRRDAETAGLDAAQQGKFSYDELEAVDGEKLRDYAKLIRAKSKVVNEAVFELGRALNDAKGLVPHGRFLPWLRSEFDWPERTAQRYMRIARVLGDKTATVAHLSLREMDALTARSTSEKLRDEVLEELAAGKTSSNRDLVARLKASRRAVAADDMVGVDDKEAEVPTVASPVDAGRLAAAFIRERLAGELVELQRLLEQADATALLAGLRQETY